MLKNKKFSKSLYDQYDLKGRIALENYFNKKGYAVEQEPFGKYGIDLKVYNDQKTFYVDSEVRENWSFSNFPFNTVHLPFRKVKFIKEYVDVFFCSIRTDLKRALFLEGKKFNIEKYILVDNKFLAQEPFLEIEVSECYYQNL